MFCSVPKSQKHNYISINIIFTLMYKLPIIAYSLSIFIVYNNIIIIIIIITNINPPRACTQRGLQ